MNTRAYGTKNLPFIQAEIILIALAAPYGLFLSLWVIVRKRLQKKQPYDTAAAEYANFHFFVLSPLPSKDGLNA